MDLMENGTRHALLTFAPHFLYPDAFFSEAFSDAIGSDGEPKGSNMICTGWITGTDIAAEGGIENYEKLQGSRKRKL